MARKAYKDLYLQTKEELSWQKHQVDAIRLLLDRYENRSNELSPEGYKVAQVPSIMNDCWHMSLSADPSNLLCRRMESFLTRLNEHKV